LIVEKAYIPKTWLFAATPLQYTVGWLVYFNKGERYESCNFKG
jgi:hypothetical protein